MFFPRSVGRYLSLHSQHGGPQRHPCRICPREYPSITTPTRAYPVIAIQVNIDDGFLNLLDGDGSAKDDVKVPEGDLGKQLESEFEAGKELLVTIVSSMGEEMALSFKEAPKGSS